LVTTPFIFGAVAPPVAAPAVTASAAAASAVAALPAAPISNAIAQGSNGNLLIQQGFGPERRSVKALQRDVQGAQPE
jgi:hypothetical protein